MREPGADRSGLEGAQVGMRMANKARDDLRGGRLQDADSRKTLPGVWTVSRAFVAPGGDGALPTSGLAATLKPVLVGGPGRERHPQGPVCRGTHLAGG